MTWFKPYGLNLRFLYETPLDWLDLVLKTVNCKVARRSSTGGRPAGLVFSPFLLIFGCFVPELKYSPKLMELVNVSKNYSITILKV